jgi:flavin-dependent dehydrogenase
MKIAIIGAGPAGLFLAERLARRRHTVTVFDHRAPWEKPCGGAVTPKIFREFPELRNLTTEWHGVEELNFILAHGARIPLTLSEPLFSISRKLLGEAMLKRALAAGAEFFSERVEDMVPAKAGFNITTRQQKLFSNFLVGADGARGISRKKLAQKFDAKDLYLAFSCIIPFKSCLPLTLRFYPDMTGYAWIFPRKKDAGFGIAAKGMRPSGKEMRDRLARFAEEELKKAGLDVPDSFPIIASQVPSLSMESLEKNQVAGPGWALIGDASGIVDPITGEGIYYAIKTADILFHSLEQDQGRVYPERLREFVAASLHRSPLWCERFYKERTQNIWGWFLGKSSLVQEILRELIQCEQDYVTLKARLLRALPRAVAQSLLSSLTVRS